MTTESKTLNTAEVLAMTGVSRAALYATLLKKLGFPKPFKIGLRGNAWFRTDVEAFINARAGVAA